MTSLNVEWEKKLKDSNGTPIPLPLQFLKDITCDFSTDELGRGGYGVVYKGFLPSGKIIAVKKIFDKHLVGDEKIFKKEVSSVMEIKHQHVVQFIGYCAESSYENIKQPSGNFIWVEIHKRLLCFEYLCNESLRKYISVPTYESPVLDWNMRYNIIKGICNGLNFLHEKCRMVHLDLKPENILMDATMLPKIADFGLSMIFGEEQSRIITYNCVGSRGYIAPEYLIQGIISMKADIFSLGVIIIEIITGHKKYPYFQLDSPESTATSCQNFMEEVLGSWSYKSDSTVNNISMEKYNKQIEQCISIALKCLDPRMEKRPTVKDVIQVLNAVDLVIPGSSALLEVHPLELCFRFEPNKLMSCSLDLTNNSDEQVAFGLVEKNNEQISILGELEMFGIVDPRTTYTLVVVMDEHETLPQEREVDLILQTSTYNGILSDEEACMRHFYHAEELGNTVHMLTLKGVCALPGETISEIIPPSFQIILLELCSFYGQTDANQAEPLIVTGNSMGEVCTWNYDAQKSMGSIKIPDGGSVSSTKFIAREGWFLVGSFDGFIHVYNYKKNMEKITSIKVGEYTVGPLAIHPTRPYVLSHCSMEIKLWDWDGWFGWKCVRTYTDRWFTAVSFNPEDHNIFVSASYDGTIKVWSLNFRESLFTLSGHFGPVKTMDFFTRDGQQYLITGSEDKTAKIWDMRKKECVRTLPHKSYVRSVLAHPKLPVLVTGTEHGHVHLWSSTNFRLKRIIHTGRFADVKGLACLKSRRVVIVYVNGLSVIEIGDEEEQLK